MQPRQSRSARVRVHEASPLWLARLHCPATLRVPRPYVPGNHLVGAATTAGRRIEARRGSPSPHFGNATTLSHADDWITSSVGSARQLTCSRPKPGRDLRLEPGRSAPGAIAARVGDLEIKRILLEIAPACDTAEVAGMERCYTNKFVPAPQLAPDCTPSRTVDSMRPHA